MTDIVIENSWEENSKLTNFIVNESDNGTLFHRPLFLQYHGTDKFPDIKPIEISFYKKEKLLAFITGAVQCSTGNKNFISPFGSSYGGLVYHRDSSFKEIEEIYYELLEYLQKEYSQIQISSTPSFQSQTGKSQYIDHILLTNGFSITKSDIILVHELDDEEKLRSRVHKKTYTELKQPLYKKKLRRITKTSNELLLRVVEDLSYVYSDGRENHWDPDKIEKSRQQFLETLHTERDAFVLQHQEILLDALQLDAVPIPVEEAARVGVSA